MLCGFFTVIGRRLRQPVLMAPEGDYQHPVLGFDLEADRVVLLATHVYLNEVRRPSGD